MTEQPKPVQQPLTTPTPPAAAPKATTAVAPPPVLSQLAKRVADLGVFLRAREGEITKEVVGDLTSKRLIGLMLSEIEKNPQLANCTPESFFHAARRMAQAGLECGPFGHAYLVPFQNKDKGTTEAQFIPGYRGLAFAACRSRAALDVDADVVMDDDDFEFRKGTEGDFLKHVPANERARDEARCRGAYCLVTLPDGRKKAWFMSKADILRRKAVSKAKDGQLWSVWWDEAYCKTVVRHSMKLLPLSHLSPDERDRIGKAYAASDEEVVNDADVTAVRDAAPTATTTAGKAMARVLEVHPEIIEAKDGA